MNRCKRTRDCGVGVGGGGEAGAPGAGEASGEAGGVAGGVGGASSASSSMHLSRMKRPHGEAEAQHLCVRPPPTIGVSAVSTQRERIGWRAPSQFPAAPLLAAGKNPIN